MSTFLFGLPLILYFSVLFNYFIKIQTVLKPLLNDIDFFWWSEIITKNYIMKVCYVQNGKLKFKGVPCNWIFEKHKDWHKLIQIFLCFFSFVQMLQFLWFYALFYIPISISSKCIMIMLFFRIFPKSFYTYSININCVFYLSTLKRLYYLNYTNILIVIINKR